MWTVAHSRCVKALVLASLLTACGGGLGEIDTGPEEETGPLYEDPQYWALNFYDAASGQFFSTTGIVPVRGGMTTKPCSVGIDIPGCNVRLNFMVRFASTDVNLEDWHIKPGSVCNGFELVEAYGTGTATGEYGYTSKVLGEGYLGYRAPNVGETGGTFLWEAFRQTARTWAEKVLQAHDEGRIILAEFHTESDDNDGATAYDNIVDVANGGLAALSPGCEGAAERPERVAISAEVLYAIYRISRYEWDKTPTITEIVGGCHNAKDTRHYLGLAVDMDVIGGTDEEICRLHDIAVLNGAQASPRSYCTTYVHAQWEVP